MVGNDFSWTIPRFLKNCKWTRPLFSKKTQKNMKSFVKIHKFCFYFLREMRIFLTVMIIDGLTKKKVSIKTQKKKKFSLALRSVKSALDILHRQTQNDRTPVRTCGRRRGYQKIVDQPLHFFRRQFHIHFDGGFAG